MLEARDVVCIRDEHVLFSALSFTVSPVKWCRLPVLTAWEKPRCCAF